MCIGRPTKYRPNMAKFALDYFKREAAAGEYPSIAGLAVELEVSKQRIYDWEQLYEPFRDALCKGRAIGEKVLTSGALKEKFNASFSKFLAINNFGMISENAKSDVHAEHTFPSGITINFVDTDKKES